MERLVKERLVGAAVLLAAAVILIPEMLSGPKHEESGQVAAPAEDAPTKTYTIDLGQPAQARGISSPSAQVETTAAPPAETTPPNPTSAPQAPPASTVEQTETKREELPAPAASAQSQSDAPKPVVSSASNPPRRDSVEPAAVTRSVAAPAGATPKPTPVASERTVPTSKGWAVQLGSFSKADTADRLAQQVRAKGHNAFVMPVKSGSGTLYRVRVGPFKDRSTAESLQRELRGENPNAAVVPHP